MRFEILVPVVAEDGRDRWFRAERRAPCVSDDVWARWAGFTLRRASARPAVGGGVQILTEALGASMVGALRENGFSEVCDPTVDAAS